MLAEDASLMTPELEYDLSGVVDHVLLALGANAEHSVGGRGAQLDVGEAVAHEVKCGLDEL